jgi:hypothetical protein
LRVSAPQACDVPPGRDDSHGTRVTDALFRRRQDGLFKDLVEGANDNEISCTGFAIGRADGKINSLRDFSGYPLVLWFGAARTDVFPSDQLAWCTQLMARVSDGDGELLAIEVDGAWCELKFRHKTVRVGLAAGLPTDGPVARAYGVEATKRFS